MAQKKFKGPLIFYKTKKQKKKKSDLNEIVRGSNKSEEQKIVIRNTKTLYESQEKVIKLFNDYSKIISEAKYKTKYQKESKY